MTGFILALIAGYAAHRLDGPIDKAFKAITPNLLARYFTGFWLIFGAFILVCDLPREQKERAAKAFMLAGMSSGVGVVVARLEDILREAARP
jgi:hypothetical protein